MPYPGMPYPGMNGFECHPWEAASDIVRFRGDDYVVAWVAIN
jgi:hypothetical protein